MNKSAFHKASLLLLTAALMFGQVGAGFFHNKHDAHETVIDLDHTVLLPHGEHCKICSVDWVHQFTISGFEFEAVKEERNPHNLPLLSSLITSSRLLTKDRAPPILA